MLLNLIQFVLQIVGMVAIGFGLIVAFEGALNALRRWSNARQDLAPHAAVLEAACPAERHFRSPGHVGTDRGRSGYQDPALGDGPQPENLYAKAYPAWRGVQYDAAFKFTKGALADPDAFTPMSDCS